MNIWNVAKYVALAIGVLVLLAIAISIVAAIVSIVSTILVAIATLLVLAGLTYATIQGVRWLRSDDNGTAESPSAGIDSPSIDTGSRSGDAISVETGSTDPVEALTDRYVSGELTEDEFERRLSLELGGSADEIDRELERSSTK